MARTLRGRAGCNGAISRMRTIIATLWLLLAATAAGAQPLPVPKTGVCPSGYASGATALLRQTEHRESSRRSAPARAIGPARAPIAWSQSGRADRRLALTRHLRTLYTPAPRFHRALPPHQSASTANRRSVAARDQTRRLPRRRAQGRRPRAALQPAGERPHGPLILLLIVEAVARLRARAL